MNHREVYEAALQSGLIDPDLSSSENWVADYGNCEAEVLEFVRLIQEIERKKEKDGHDGQWNKPTADG